MSDKRQLPRVNWFIEAKVFCLDENIHWNVRLTDISEGGCYFESTVPLEPGLKVALKIDDGDLKLEIPGQILYGQTGIGSAMQFDPLAANLREQILQIIASRNVG